MRSFYGLLKKDLKAYFDQPTGYILLVIFTALVSYLYFRNALVNEEASIRALFTTMPWVFAIFVPASTMRLLAEEQRDGTLEILLTQPLRGWVLIATKFLAAFLFVGVAVLLTLGIPLALTTAGDLDGGAVFAQYVGTLLLLASFVAIGLFSSSLTQNQIVAFMVGLTLTLGLTLIGLPLVTQAIPVKLAVIFQDLSPLTHYGVVVRGAIDLRDVLYFLAVVSAFMSGTYLLLRGKSISHRSGLYMNLRLGVAALVVVSLLVGWLGTEIKGRWDLTEGKAYTLSSAGKDLLADLDDIVTIKLFASKEPPADIALVARDLRDLLEDMEAASDGNVRLIVKHPDEDAGIADEASRNFVQPAEFNVVSEGEFSVKLGWLGLSMTYANRRETLPFIGNVSGLEPLLMSGIYRMAQKSRKTIAFLSEHGEKRIDADIQTFRNIANAAHNVIEITDSEGFIDLEQVDILVIPGPTEIVRGNVYAAIDDFLARGGKALLMLDAVTIDQQTLRANFNPTSMADFVEGYGVGIPPSLVFDPRSSESLAFSSRALGAISIRYPYWARVETAEPRISGGIGGVVMPWASSLEILDTADPSLDAELNVLLQTSRFAVLDEAFLDLDPFAPTLELVAAGEQSSRVMAVSITGTRCLTIEPECTKDPNNPFRMIVVGDSDWITDNMVSRYPDQLALAINYIDWLAEDDALAAIRSKDISFRPLLFDSDTHRNLVQYGNLIGVPVLLVLLGLIRFLMRRRVQRKVYEGLPQ